MLKRNPSLTDQAKAHIKQRILDGHFEEGRIPSETELANELGVSRTTIRDALSRLENEGVVYRRQGAGTFVNKAGLQIKTRLEEIWSYEAVLQAHGYTPSTRILGVAVEPADAHVATELNLPAGAEIISVEKLFLEDDAPVIFTVNQIPRQLIHEPYEDEDWKVPIYEFLQKHGPLHLSYYLSEIVPVVAAAEVAANLEIVAGAPLISFAEIGYGEENTPILRAFSYIRDDLLRLRLIRRQV